MRKNEIKLTESDLEEEMKGRVQTEDESYENSGKIDVNSIDISKIDIEILKEAYVDLRLVPTRTSNDTFLSNIPRINDIYPQENVESLKVQKKSRNRE